MTRKIEVTMADLVVALRRQMFLPDGVLKKVMAAARRIAIERAIEDNAAETARLIGMLDTPERLDTLDGINAYRKRQDRITVLFKEHDELLDMAYPTTAEVKS